MAISYFLEDKYILESFYISLYIYQYTLPQKYIIKFNELITDFNIKNRFEEYVQKHVSISQNYSKIFGVQMADKNNLQIFYNDTKEIDTINYNPKIIKNILDNYYWI